VFPRADFPDKRPAAPSPEQQAKKSTLPADLSGDFTRDQMLDSAAKLEPASRRASSLMNLISKSKNKTNHEEIDLFEEETHGVSAESYYRNVELENYWVFLKNNIGNKNIMVIPIEDDEAKDSEDPGLWRFPLKDCAKWNRKATNSKGKTQQPLLFDKSRQKPQDFGEGIATDRAKWVNCVAMDIKSPNYVEKRKPRGPRLINLS
jgi:hypothetical protein